MATVDGTPGGLSAEPHFLATAHAEVNDRFLPLNDQDPYYWIPTLSSTGTPTCGAIGAKCRDITVSLPGLASASFTAPVKARLRGVTFDFNINPDAEVTVTIYRNGKVAASHAVGPGGLTDAEIKSIIADTGKILK